MFTSIFNLNADALPIIGDIYKYAVQKAFNKKALPQSTPLLGDIQTEIGRLAKDGANAEDYLQSIGYLLLHVGSGYNSRAIYSMTTGVGDIATGDIAKGSQTCFIYNYNEQWGDENISHYEKYFSNNPSDWGIWELNENNEKTMKVTNAYQWHCNMAYELDNYFVDNIFPASQGEFAPKFDIDNYYWWVMKVWEVKSNLTEQIAYCPFNGTAGATTQEHCLTSAGLEAVLPDGEKWIYTGGFNGDFLGRYTKLQNGEL